MCWVEQHPFKIHVHLETQNFTSFDNNLCRCKSVKMRSYWIRVGPKSNEVCLYKKSWQFRHRETQREGGHVKMEAEVGDTDTNQRN